MSVYYRVRNQVTPKNSPTALKVFSVVAVVVTCLVLSASVSFAYAVEENDSAVAIEGDPVAVMSEESTLPPETEEGLNYSSTVDDGFDAHFSTTDGSLPSYDSGWTMVGTNLCYYRDNVVLKGVANVDGHWYYFNPDDGRMMTGPQHIDGKWYYYHPNDGRMVFGSQYIDGKWYYYDSVAGFMHLGPQYLNGSWYYYDYSAGFMLTGWQNLEGRTYYYNTVNGTMCFGATFIDGGWYLLHRYAGYLQSSDHALVQGLVNISNQLGLHNLSPWDGLVSSFNYVKGFSYRSGSLWPQGDWTGPLAVEMMQMGSGNCYRYAALFQWLAIYCGYDARAIVGSVPSYSSGTAPHGWVEVYDNGATFVCDPGMAHDLPGYGWFFKSYEQMPTTYYR